MSTNDKRDEERGDMAGRLPSLEEQTPGFDTEQVQQTDRDAEAFFSTDAGAGARASGGRAKIQGTGEQESGEEFAKAAGRGEGADEGLPPGGDVRTVYENEREPGEAMLGNQGE